VGLFHRAANFDEPDIAKAGAPERLRSGWINGIKRLPVTCRP
jgi:hypothetical protein